MREGHIPGVRCDLQELVALRGQLGSLARLVQRRVAEPLSGGHLSPFRGRGMEYAESRPYAPGDDVRHIDWRVTARSGRTHTKLFQPERERTTAVLYDTSASMAFGTRSCFKSVQAARLAALMLWQAASEGHRLAVASNTDAAQYLPPLGGRRGVLRALDALVRWQPALGDSLTGQEPARLEMALETLRRILRPGSRLLMLLDPRTVTEGVAMAVQRLRAHHDLAACLLVDPIEQTAPPAGQYRIGNGQQTGVLALSSPAQRKQWQTHFSQQHQHALLQLRRTGTQTLLVSVDTDPVEALGALLSGAAFVGEAVA